MLPSMYAPVFAGATGGVAQPTTPVRPSVFPGTIVPTAPSTPSIVSPNPLLAGAGLNVAGAAVQPSIQQLTQQMGQLNVGGQFPAQQQVQAAQFPAQQQVQAAQFPAQQQVQAPAQFPAQAAQFPAQQQVTAQAAAPAGWAPYQSPMPSIGFMPQTVPSQFPAQAGPTSPTPGFFIPPSGMGFMGFAPEPRLRLNRPAGKYKLMLEKEQLPHYNRYATEIIPDTRMRFWFDTSDTGTGKTFIEGFISISLLPAELTKMGWRNVPLLWLGPKAIIPKVELFLEEYGLDNYGAYSYSSLSGRATKRGFSQPKSGIIEKDLTASTPKQAVYRVTEDFARLIRQEPGLILVVDESHNIKNKASARSAAVSAIVQAVLSSQHGFVAFLSATPLDKEKHAIAYLKVMGFISDQYKKSAFKVRGEFRLGYAGEVITMAYNINPQKTNEILNRSGASAFPNEQNQLVISGIWDDRTAKEIMYLCFKEVIYALRSSRMRMEKPVQIRNLYLYQSEAALRLINQTVLQVIQDVQYDPLTGQVASKARKGTNIGRYIKQLNDALSWRMPQYIDSHLKKYPNRKVIFFTKSVEAATWVSNSLRSMGWPALLQTGEIKEGDRLEATRAFQEDSGRFRVLISTTATGGIGVDYDDKTSNWPRTLFITPDFSLIDLIQAMGRVRRLSTKSVPWIYVIYPINYVGNKIEDIQTAMIVKGDVIKDFTETRGEKIELSEIFGPDIKYPNQYERELETSAPSDGNIYPAAVGVAA